MTKILNDPGCSVYGGNTGTPGCAFFPDQIVGAILIDKDKEFTNANLDTFVATLQALTIAGSATRIYPIFRFDAITDNSEDISVKTLGYGGKQVSKEGKYDLTFEMSQGGFCHHQQLRKFNNDKSKKVLLIDSNNIVFGVRTASEGLKGFMLDFMEAYPFKFNSGEEQAKFMLRFAFAKPSEMNEDLGYFDAGEDVEDAIKGLLDIEMYDLGAGSATKKHIVGIRTVCDKVSLYDAYSTAFIHTLFTATLVGVADNPTAIAPVAASKGWELTFPTVGVHIVTLTTPSALATAHIGEPPDNGYEVTGTLSITVA